jgi:hypothetical protein
MISYFRTIFSLDLRALALMRMLIGAGLVLDMIQRFLVREEFYSDLGVLTRSALVDYFEFNGSMSLLMLNGSPHFAGFLAIVGMISGLMICFGHGTRFFTLMGWILLSSFHARHNLAIHGGDNLLRILLLYGIFLPIGERWSLDTFLSGKRLQENLFFSWFSVLIVIQIFWIYLFTTIYKWHPVWISEFSSLHYALSLDIFSTDLGKWLTQFPEFLRYSSMATIVIEAVVPFFLFIPFYSIFFRRFAILSFYALHLGIQLTMVLGLFPLACLAAWTSLWDSKSMDRLESWIGPWLNRHLSWLRKISVFPWLQYTRTFQSWWSRSFALLIMALVLAWNIEGTAKIKNFEVKSPFDEIVFFLQLNQQWNMFAPSPLTDDGYMVVDGELEDGRMINPLTKGPVDFTKPENFADSYLNTIWRKYLLTLYMVDGAAHRLHFGRFLCRRWNSDAVHSNRLKRFKIYYMRIQNRGPDMPRAVDAEPVMIWRHFCYGEVDEFY